MSAAQVPRFQSAGVAASVPSQVRHQYLGNVGQSGQAVSQRGAVKAGATVKPDQCVASLHPATGEHLLLAEHLDEQAHGAYRDSHPDIVPPSWPTEG